jgi:hypothetical protein
MDNDDVDVDQQPRMPLLARLEAFLPSTSTTALNIKQDPMKFTPPAYAAATASRASLPHLHVSNSVNNRASPSPTHGSPIVRWLSSWSSTPQRSPTSSRDRSPIRRPPSAPPSPGLASLNEALSCPLPSLPRKPPYAHVPSHFCAGPPLSRPPPLLDNVARSTFPTASLSQPPLYMPHFSSHSRSPSLDLLDSPTPNPPQRGRSSIDSLRSVSNRSLHTSAAPLDIQTRFNWWWNEQDGRGSVDPLLSDADRAETAPQQQEHIRKKCLSFSLSRSLSTLR